jgi:hypothetical protein
MKVDELVGSLQTLEISINERGDKKNKSITFVTNADDEESQADGENEESIVYTTSYSVYNCCVLLFHVFYSENEESIANTAVVCFYFLRFILFCTLFIWSSIVLEHCILVCPISINVGQHIVLN